MTSLEARLRLRFRPLSVTVFVLGENVFEGDGDVVKVRRARDGVRLWTYWPSEQRVMEWWFPRPDEVRIERI